MGWIVFGVIFLALLAFVLLRKIFRSTETPRYRVVEKQGPIEIREYGGLITAYTQVVGERQEAIRKGFAQIARYIFGGNSASKKVSMTAPVLQERERDCWIVRFVMPVKYTMQTLPKPHHDDIQLGHIQARRLAVIRFSGAPDANELEKQTAVLTAFLQRRHLEPLSHPMYAFYNPPWTLPSLRRNEVWIEV